MCVGNIDTTDITVVNELAPSSATVSSPEKQSNGSAKDQSRQPFNLRFQTSSTGEKYVGFKRMANWWRQLESVMQGIDAGPAEQVTALEARVRELEERLSKLA